MAVETDATTNKNHGVKNMSPYLRKTIMTTLAAIALTAVGSPASASCSDNSICLDDLPGFDPPGPGTPSPELPDPGEVYPDEPGGDSGNDGGGGDPAPTPDFAACLNLQNTQPHGCTRDLAAAGLQTPTSLTPSSWQGLGAERSPLLSNEFRVRLNGALNGLNGCYADVTKAPEMCELQFAAQLGNGGAIQSLGSMLDPWSFAFGLSSIATSLLAAPNVRTGASWVTFLGAAVGKISIDFSGVGASLASLNGFNDALYKARLQKGCTLWVGAWDQANCQ